MTGSGRRDQVLLGAVLCCTAVPENQRARFKKIIKKLGGKYELDLTSAVTHLLVNVSHAPTVEHLTEKYKYVAANRPDVRVLRSSWLMAIVQSWMTVEKFNLQDLEEKYKLPIFAGLWICLTGFEDLTFRARLQDLIDAYGGNYRGDLTKNVTHLIADAPEGMKYQHAEEWHIPVVSRLWFEDCLKRGMVLEASLYHPTISLEEQRKGAWNREAKSQVQLEKRPRDLDLKRVAILDCPNLALAPKEDGEAAEADLRSQATSVSFDGPLAPGSGTFSPATLPRNPEPRHKKPRRACISCTEGKTKCDGSKPICGHCQAYRLPCSYPNPERKRERKRARDRESQRINQKRIRGHIENLKQQVADQSEHLNEALQCSSKLEAQIAALQDMVAPYTSDEDGTISCDTERISTPDLDKIVTGIVSRKPPRYAA